MYIEVYFANCTPQWRLCDKVHSNVLYFEKCMYFIHKHPFGVLFVNYTQKHINKNTLV